MEGRRDPEAGRFRKGMVGRMTLDREAALEKIDRIIDSYKVYSGHGYIVPAKRFNDMVEELKKHFTASLDFIKQDVLEEIGQIDIHTLEAYEARHYSTIDEESKRCAEPSDDFVNKVTGER